MGVRMTAQQRTVLTKGAARQLRRSGRLPAVLYGQQLEMPIHVATKDVEKQLRTGRMELMELEVEGGDHYQVIIAEVQRDSLTGELLHVDFQQVSMDKPIKLKVPVELIGAAQGVKEGGVLIIQETSVELEGLPGVIPPVIELDVSQLNVGDSIHASDLKLPEGVTLLSSPEDLLVSITLPRGVQDTEEATDQVAAEA